MDPTVHARQSDRTSGFTSPSHFSSPSFPIQPLFYPRVGTPVSPSDTDCTSSLSAAAPSPTNVQTSWGPPTQGVPATSQDKIQPRSLTTSQQRIACVPLASEEEGSHTHTSTLKPNSHTQNTNPGTSPPRAVSQHIERLSSLEDPVVLSL